jgi:hypothetical protein
LVEIDDRVVAGADAEHELVVVGSTPELFAFNGVLQTIEYLILNHFS